MKYGNREIRSITVLVVMLLAGLPGWSQSDEASGAITEPHRFEEPAWKELTKDLDYSPLGKIREEKPKERSGHNAGDTDASEQKRNPAIRIDSPLLTNIIKFALILAAAVALTVLLKHLLGFGGFPRNKKINIKTLDQAQLEHIEENLHESELERFIRQAIEQEQYALAIRLYFLAILKELSIGEAIRWKKNKTNRAYLWELRNHPVHEDFRQTANIFERVWYGNRELDFKTFRNVEDHFSVLLQKLRRNARKE